MPCLKAFSLCSNVSWPKGYCTDVADVKYKLDSLPISKIW